MVEQYNTRNIVVSKLTKDIEHLLTGGGAKNVRVPRANNERDGRDSDLIIGRSGKVYSRKKIAEFTSGKKKQVVFKISSYRKTLRDIKNHLNYVTRNSKVPLEDQNGNILSREERNAIAEQWHDLELMKAKARAKYLGKELDEKSYPRVAASIVLSMPPGTNRERFAEAVREYAQEEFADKGYEYMLAFHNDTKHPHAHLLLRMRNVETNRKLNPGKNDIKKWREALQEKMDEHGLESVSISRRLRGLMPSLNSLFVHMDYKEMRNAMLVQGMTEHDADHLLEEKSQLEKVMNRAEMLSRRQKNLRQSVSRALADPKVAERLEAFTQARREERLALREAIGNVARDIVMTNPEDAGALIDYANNLPDPTPPVQRILDQVNQRGRGIDSEEVR